MKIETLDISEARKQFNKLDEMLQDEQVICITRHGKKVFAVVDLGYLQTVLETIDVLSDPDAARMLQESIQNIRRKEIFDHEDVKRELL